MSLRPRWVLLGSMLVGANFCVDPYLFRVEIFDPNIQCKSECFRSERYYFWAHSLWGLVLDPFFRTSTWQEMNCKAEVITKSLVLTGEPSTQKLV